MPTYTVNGKTYNDLNEMPPEIRQAYEKAMGVLADNNHNGVPDVLEGLQQPDGQTNITKISVGQVVVDGKVYTNPEDLPPEVREKYERAMAKIGQLKGVDGSSGMSELIEKALLGAAETELPESNGVSSIKVTPNVNVNIRTNGAPVNSEPLVNDQVGQPKLSSMVIGGLVILVLVLVVVVVMLLLK